jgi:DNA-binding PadR family transcriptional regulator
VTPRNKPMEPTRDRAAQWRVTSQPFRLTPQGRKLLEKAVPAWSAAQQQVKQVLGDEMVNQLNRAVKRIGAAAAG